MIYYNGLQIGEIRKGAFVLGKYTNLDGSKRPLEFDDFPHLSRFTNWDEFIFCQLQVIGKLKQQLGLPE